LLTFRPFVHARGDEPSYVDLDASLLACLARDTLFQRLARLKVAAGQLPAVNVQSPLLEHQPVTVPPSKREGGNPRRPANAGRDHSGRHS
jgi:hypothetical protein